MYTCMYALAYAASDLTYESQSLGHFQWEFRRYFSLDVELVSVSSFSNNVEVRSSDIILEYYPHSPPCFSLCMYVYTCIAANAYTAVDLTHESQRLRLFQWEFRRCFSLDVELVSVSSFSNIDEVRSSDISRENYPHSPPSFLMCMYVHVYCYKGLHHRWHDAWVSMFGTLPLIISAIF